MKKIGQFFFALIPFFLVIGMQFLASIFAMGLSTVIESFWYNTTGGSQFPDVLDHLSSFWMSQQFNTYVMIIYALMTITAFGLWYYIKYDGSYLPNPRNTFHPLSIIGIIMLVPGMQYLSTYIVAITVTLFPHWMEIYEELMETAGLNDTFTVGLFIYSVLLAPFSEELIFRGVTMRQLRKCLPFWAANVMQAILFGAFHMNMIQGIYAFCLGLILGYVCEKGGSIYYSILLHLLFNFWAAALSQFFTIGESTVSIVCWFLFACVMTIGGLLIFYGGICKLKSTADTTASEEFRSVN